MLHNFKTKNNSSKPKNVVFVKIGKLVQNETLKLPAPNELSHNFGSKLDEKGINDIRLEQNPDQNYVVLQTEASASVASNIYNINSQSSLNGHSLINEAAEYQRPIADDFDDINEEDETSSFSQTTDAKTIFAEKSKNRALYSNKEMESFHSRFGNIIDSKINEGLDSDNGTKSVEESDEEEHERAENEPARDTGRVPDGDETDEEATEEASPTLKAQWLGQFQCVINMEKGLRDYEATTTSRIKLSMANHNAKVSIGHLRSEISSPNSSVVPRVLADDIMIIYHGDHLSTFVTAMDRTYAYLEDLGCKVAPTKSFLFSTDKGCAFSRNTYIE